MGNRRFEAEIEWNGGIKADAVLEWDWGVLSIHMTAISPSTGREITFCVIQQGREKDDGYVGWMSSSRHGFRVLRMGRELPPE